MKSTRVTAFILASALTVSVLAGCNKNADTDISEEEEEIVLRTTWITTEEFADACEEMGLVEIDLDDVLDDTDTVEEGFYAVGDGKYVSRKADKMDDYLDDFGISGAIDTEDIESFAIAAKCDGFSDLKDVSSSYGMSSYSDAKVDGAFAFQMSLKDNYTDKVMDRIEDKLNEYGIDTKDLSEEEFYKSDNEGYLRLHIDVAEFIDCALNNKELTDLLDEMYYGLNPFEDLRGSVRGDVAISIEINEQNLFIIAAFAINKGAKEIDGFVTGFNAIADPMDTSVNSEATESYVDALIMKLKEVVEGAQVIAESILDNDALGDIGYELEDIFGG